jgi:hypothetical protein
LRNRYYLVLILILTCGLILSCSVHKGGAEKVANSYFEAIERSDFNAALTYYSEAFFGNTPKDKAYQELQDIQNKFGELTSYKQTKWTIIHSVGDEKHPKGNTYIFKYELKYTKCEVTLDLYLFQPDSDVNILIQGYNMISSALK